MRSDLGIDGAACVQTPFERFTSDSAFAVNSYFISSLDIGKSLSDALQFTAARTIQTTLSGAHLLGVSFVTAAGTLTATGAVLYGGAVLLEIYTFGGVVDALEERSYRRSMLCKNSIVVGPTKLFGMSRESSASTIMRGISDRIGRGEGIMTYDRVDPPRLDHPRNDVTRSDTMVA